MMPSVFRIAEIVLYSLLNFLPFLFLAFYPFRNKLRFSYRVTGLLTGLVTLIRIGFGVWAALFVREDTGLLSAVSTAVYLAFYFLAIKAHPGKTVFTLLMLSNIANLVVILSKCIEGLLFYEYALQPYRWTFSLVLLMVESLLLTPLFFYIRGTYTAAFEKKVVRPVWRYLWLIPATFYVIWYYHLYGSERTSLELALRPANALFMFFINLGAILIYHMLIRMVHEMDRNIALSEQNHQLAMQNLQYANLKERIAEARHAKHDIRQHISVMDSYLQKEEYGKLRDYLNSYRKSLPDDSTIQFCDHHATNALLLYFAQQAKDHDIDYSVHAAIPEALGIPESDLSVVLGNLLENAVDAASARKDADKRITVHAKTDGSALFITIDNTFEGPLEKDKKGRYRSTKKNGSGLGLSSVRSTVDRLGGRLTIDTQENLFCVSVMLFL